MKDIHSIQFVHQNNELKTKIKRKHYLVVLIEKLTYSNGILYHYANNVIYQFVGIHLLRKCQIKIRIKSYEKIVNQKKIERKKKSGKKRNMFILYNANSHGSVICLYFLVGVLLQMESAHFTRFIMLFLCSLTASVHLARHNI